MAGKGAKKRPRLSLIEGGSAVLYPTRSFIAVWGDHADWWEHYDPEQIARELPEEHWQLFEHTVTGTVTFADQVRAARQAMTAEQTG
jgi:ParB family chromosome partitioning protein